MKLFLKSPYSKEKNHEHLAICFYVVQPNLCVKWNMLPPLSSNRWQHYHLAYAPGVKHNATVRFRGENVSIIFLCQQVCTYHKGISVDPHSLLVSFTHMALTVSSMIPIQFTISKLYEIALHSIYKCRLYYFLFLILLPS